MEDKTNVMRILDKKKVTYRCYTYEAKEAESSIE